jgi:hypothetical protein
MLYNGYCYTVAVWYSWVCGECHVIRGQPDGMAIIQFPVVLFCTNFARSPAIAKMRGLRRHDEDGRARVRSSLSLDYLLGRHNSMVTFRWH